MCIPFALSHSKYDTGANERNADSEKCHAIVLHLFLFSSLSVSSIGHLLCLIKISHTDDDERHRYCEK